MKLSQKILLEGGFQLALKIVCLLLFDKVFPWYWRLRD